MRVRFIASSLAAAFFLLPAFSHAQEKAHTPPPLVKVVETGSNTGDVTRQFFGRVAARQTVDLAFQVSGQITEFPVIEGQPVLKGGLIARLDQEPFELSLDQARVQKTQSDRTLERLKRLSGNTVSQVTVDDAQTASDLNEIAVRNAERSLRNATLHAPFNALVAARNVNNFTTINAGSPIVRLHDMSEIRIEIDVPEVLFGRGARDDVTVMARFAGAEGLFPLEVREFNAETSQVGQTFRITFGMAPPEGITVLPGSSVTVIATIHGEATGIALPASAILKGNDNSTHVLLYTPGQTPDQGTVKKQAVRITPSPDGEVQVVEGLEPGDMVVASGVSRLSDGEAVRRFTGFAN